MRIIPFFICHKPKIDIHVSTTDNTTCNEDKDGVGKRAFKLKTTEINSPVKSADTAIGLLNLIFNLNNFTKKESLTRCL